MDSSNELAEGIRRAVPRICAEDATELGRIVTTLVATFHPERIYLFGSQARGDVDPDSDIDLLVVTPPDVQEPSYRLAQRAGAAIGTQRIGVDVVFMPRDRFEERLPVVMSLPSVVTREGILLYDAAALPSAA